MLCTSMYTYYLPLWYGTIHEIDVVLSLAKLSLLVRMFLAGSIGRGVYFSRKLRKEKVLSQKVGNRKKKRLKRRRWIEIYLLHLENSRPM